MKLYFQFDKLQSVKIPIQFLGYHSEWGAKIGRIRIRVRKMCKQQWWFWLVVTLVFLNTCTVAVEHYGQPAWLTNFLGKFINCYLQIVIFYCPSHFII